MFERHGPLAAVRKLDRPGEGERGGAVDIAAEANSPSRTASFIQRVGDGIVRLLIVGPRCSQLDRLRFAESSVRVRTVR